MLLSVIQIFFGLRPYDGAISSKTFHKIKEINGILKECNFSALELNMVFVAEQLEGGGISHGMILLYLTWHISSHN